MAATGTALPSWKKRRRRFFQVLLFVVSLTICLYLLRVPILTSAARALIATDPLAPADAILVLGGGFPSRPETSARLYLDGFAPLLLVPRTKPSPAEEAPGAVLTSNLTKSLLVSHGIPPSAVQFLGADVASTRDEAEILHDWCLETRAKRVLVVTDLFHSRRARRIIRKRLASTFCEIRMRPATMNLYSANNWWQTTAGRKAFKIEFIKSIYYYIRY